MREAAEAFGTVEDVCQEAGDGGAGMHWRVCFADTRDAEVRRQQHKEPVWMPSTRALSPCRLSCGAHSYVQRSGPRTPGQLLHAVSTSIVSE